MWARDKFLCSRHKKIALLIFRASELAKITKSTYGRIRNGETKYLFASRRREEFRAAFFEARDSILAFWLECPASLYGEYVRVRDAERATDQSVLGPLIVPPAGPT